MKLKIITLLLTILICYSCSNTDDSSIENTTNLIGTKWVNTDTTKEKDFYSFISETEYVYTEERLGSTKGTYTFNGKTGIFLEVGESYDFEISNNILSLKNQSDLYKKD